MKRTKQFELKECSQCGTEYKHYAVKKYQLCVECTKKHRSAQSRMTLDERKKPYPLNKNEQKKRYTRLRKALNNCRTREEKNAFYDRVLKEIIETGIYLWCTDLRQPVKPLEPGSGKTGRKPKNGTDPKKKYPDTRMKYEEL